MTRSIRLDPHVHTAASYDSRAAVADVLAAARSANLDAIAITDHDTMRGARRARALRRETDPVVVPGVEVSSADGHVLALGVRECPARDQPLSATIESVRDQGGIALLPHPFQRTRHGVSRTDMVDCDGLEVYNAMAMTGYQNRRARLFAAREGYTKIGGSDAHHPNSVGRAYTEVELSPREEPLSVERIIAGLRAGATEVVGRRSSVRRYLGKVLYNVRLRTAERLRPSGRLKRG